MSKYESLTAHLRRYPHSHYPVSFGDIEAIIAGKLPSSAYKYPAWWSNNPSNNVMTGAWLKAGWESSNVDVAGRKLVFRRKAGQPLPPAPAPLSAAPVADGLTLSISGISQGLMARLAAKARHQGKTVERFAHDLLVQHSMLTVTERLVMADRIRGEGPTLGRTDVPGMIRADRDGDRAG